MKRALVLGGAGAVCSETTRDLAAHSSFDEIVVAEGNLAAAEALVAELGGGRLRARQFDADDDGALPGLFSGFDVVVNGLPYRYDLAVTRACVAAGVSGLDLSTEEDQFDFDRAARAAGVVFVPGVGATPGVTNLLVARAAEALDSIEVIEIAFAAFRCLAPAPGLLRTTLWEFNPDEPARQRVYFEDGGMRPAPPLSGGAPVDFGGQIGTQTAYLVPHPETATLPRSYPGVRRVTVRGCFASQVMRLMTTLFETGMIHGGRVPLAEGQLPAIEVLHALLLNSPSSRENEVWGYGLVVAVTGSRGGKSVRMVSRSRHPPQDDWGGPAAYYKNVGIPLAIGAEMIAAGEILARGVLAPERAFASDPFLQALARRGITMEHWQEASQAD